MRGALRILCAVLSAFAACAAASGLPWEVWESPSRFAALDAGDIVVEHSSHCPGGCRYDRSNRGPESAVENPYPARWIHRDGDEVVVFDERGPGALTRFWMTTGDGISRCIDPSIRVLFRLDGASVPTLDVPLAALFDGSTPPFTAPLVAERLSSSGGYVSRVPIAYAQSLRISLRNAEAGANACDPSGWGLLWYQFQAHRLAPGTPVSSFVAGQDSPGLRAFLSASGDDPWHAMVAPQSVAGVLSAQSTLLLATRAGSGWLRGIRLQVPAAVRDHVHLRVWFDGALGIDLRVAEFFAAGASASATRSALFGEDASGRLYAWWPMPFANALRVELVGSADLVGPVVISGDLSVDKNVAPSDGARFHAGVAEQCSPSGDLSVFSHRGAGKIVGISARYRTTGPANLAYLEGDERAYVDGALAPAWYGTGVEDLHDGGFYFDQGEFVGALSGATAVDRDGGMTTSAYRVLATDPLVYASGVRLTQEAGLSPQQGVPMCARHVVYGYRRDQSTIVDVDGFEVGNSASAQAHAHTLPIGASCGSRSGAFADEPPTPRTASVCRYASGSTRMQFNVRGAVAPLRLRRTFDVSGGTPGSIAGAPAADVVSDGVVVGRFPPAPSNPLRLWQQQEIVLGAITAVDTLVLDIVPQFATHADDYSESAWLLRGGWTDSLFVDGFDGAPSETAP